MNLMLYKWNQQLLCRNSTKSKGSTVGGSEFPKIKQFAWNHYGDSQFLKNNF